MRMNSDFAGKHVLGLCVVFLAPYTFTGEERFVDNTSPGSAQVLTVNY